MKQPLPAFWDQCEETELLSDLCQKAKVSPWLVNEPWLRISEKNRKKLEEVYVDGRTSEGA